MKHFLVNILLFFSFTISFNPAKADTRDEYIVYEQNGKQGLKNSEGKVVIPAKYQALGWSRGKVEVVAGVLGFKNEGNWGLLSIDHEVIKKPQFTQLYKGNGEYLVAARVENQYRDYLGLISPTGKEVIPFEYAHLDLAGSIVVVARKTSQKFNYGLINLKREVVIPLKHKNISYLGGGLFAVKNFEDRTAIFNDKGKIVYDFMLDSIGQFKNNHAVIYHQHQRGLINHQGQIVLEPVYESISHDNKTAQCKPFDQWYRMDRNQNITDTFHVANVAPYKTGYLRMQANGLHWIADQQGQQTSARQFDHILQSEGNLAAYAEKGKWGVLNAAGKIKIPARYDMTKVYNDLVVAKGNSGWALYDSFNIRKTRYYYQQIDPMEGRLFPVKKDGFWGFINRMGEEVIPCVYESVGNFKAGYLPVAFHGKKGIINKQNEWIILPHDADSISIINDRYFLTYQGDLVKLLDAEEELIYFTQNKLEVKDGYLLEYTSDGELWKIDFSGQIEAGSADDMYEMIREPSEGFYAIKKDGAYGFIDKQNRLRIANRYEDVGDFHEGLAAFQLRGKWGFMNKMEKIVVQPVYEKVREFRSGVSIAYSKSGAGLISSSGEELTSFDYDSLEFIDDNKLLAYKHGKIGVVDTRGRVMINVKYEELKILENGYFIVKKFDEYGLVDEQGVNLIPIIYDKMIYLPYTNQYLGLKKSTTKKVQL
ncbi:MAG: WG repeat-containing protein [Fulvivirga sp.]|nr:WG repeat-containing protein [Fulvivirga sp.]